MVLASAARTHVGRRRTINEDAILNEPGRGLWAVSDGMGGHDAGEVASALVVELLGRDAVGVGLAPRMSAAREALAAANARLVAMGQEGDARRTIGATVAVFAAQEGSFACLWAGDSRIYRARDGVLSQLTRDHSLVQELVDAGELHPSEAASHPNANVIRRAVGAAPSLMVDELTGALLSGDRFLLATDGLTRLASNEEMLAALMSDDLGVAADGLIELSLHRGAPDNVSVILVGPSSPAT